MSSQALTPADHRFTSDEIAGIETFEQAMQIIAALHDGVIDSAEDYGTGLTVIDKSDLVEKPFLIIDWSFREGDMGEYAVVRVIDPSNQKWVFADGGSGVCSQLRKITAARIAAGSSSPNTGLACPAGLVRSDYRTKITDEKGKVKEIPATTYYIAGA